MIHDPPALWDVLADMMEPQPVDVALKAIKRAMAQNCDLPGERDLNCALD